MKADEAAKQSAHQPEELASGTRSLGEHHASVAVPEGASLIRKFLAFAGPGYLVSVGYMDPGNWATSIAGAGREPWGCIDCIACATLALRYSSISVVGTSLSVSI